MNSENGANTSNEAENFRSYAWNYFLLHANQRIQSFQLYITLSTALIGGFVLVVKDGSNHSWIAVSGLLLAFLSFLFWKLDRRTYQLLDNAKTALIFLDKECNLADRDNLPHPLRIFTREDKLKSQRPYWDGFTYTRCFNWVFLTFAIVGFGSSIILFFSQC